MAGVHELVVVSAPEHRRVRRVLGLVAAGCGVLVLALVAGGLDGDATSLAGLAVFCGVPAAALAGYLASAARRRRIAIGDGRFEVYSWRGRPVVDEPDVEAVARRRITVVGRRGIGHETVHVVSFAAGPPLALWPAAWPRLDAAWAAAGIHPTDPEGAVLLPELRREISGLRLPFSRRRPLTTAALGIVGLIAWQITALAGVAALSSRG